MEITLQSVLDMVAIEDPLARATAVIAFQQKVLTDQRATIEQHGLVIQKLSAALAEAMKGVVAVPSVDAEAGDETESVWPAEAGDETESVMDAVEG